MSRKTFFVLAAAALMALAGVASAGGDRCDEIIKEYSFINEYDVKQYNTMNVPKDCTLDDPDNTPSNQSYLEYAQYYEPKCTRPLLIHNITFVLAAESLIGKNKFFNDFTVIIRKSKLNDEGNIVPENEPIYQKVFSQYEFNTARAEFTFPIDYCTS